MSEADTERANTWVRRRADEGVGTKFEGADLMRGEKKNREMCIIHGKEEWRER